MVANAKRRRVEIIGTAHPVSDRAGLDPAERLEAAMFNPLSQDPVIGLICDEGSAVRPAPQDGFALADEIA